MTLLRPRHMVVLLAGLSAPALAQQSATDAAIQRVEVKGTAAGYDPRRDDTATRIVVGREEIGRYGDTSLTEIFKRIPGVSVVTGSGRSTQVQMRGLGAGYTQVLVDGERTPPGFSLESLSPDVIERIEVLRAATADMSTESVAGTINIVLRKTVRKRERGVKLGHQLSSDFRGPTVSFELADRADKSSYAISGSVNHDSFRREALGVEENTRPDGRVDLFRTTTVPETGHMNGFSLGPRVNWTLDNGDTLAWQALLNGNRFRNNAHGQVLTFIGRPPPTPDLHTRSIIDYTALSSDLSWTHAMASGAKLEAKFGVEGTWNKRFLRRMGNDAAGLPETDGSIRNDARAKGANSTGKLTRELAGGHVLAAGWDVRINTSDDIRVEQDTVRAFAPGQVLDEDFGANVRRAAFYAQDEWTITPAWSLYAGARWEGVHTRVTGNTVEPTSVRSSVWSPVLQTLWKLPGKDGKHGDQLRLALSRTYKAPEMRNLVPDRSAWENNSATEADFVGNPRLRPELAWGVDAAWEHYWAEGAMFSIGASMRRIDDYTSNEIFFDGLRWIFRPVNDGRARVRTIDLETKFPLKTLVEGAPAIELRASLSRNWSRVASVPGPNNRMEMQTPLTAKLGLDWQAGSLSAGASLSHRRGGPIRVTANRGFYEMARTDLDTYALWKFNAKAQLRVALSNLLGEDGAWGVSYADPVTGLEKRSWRYPGGIKLRSTLELKF
ncbi:TonB-dependent receptor plug domain-containing protein [Massilia consociata]|uniref:TonB-dependent receptor plug domain-containing protein n=1 Tax=Massilia consociata TaxID=760117 RepID=A0ABV6FE90_9BURK